MHGVARAGPHRAQRPPTLDRGERIVRDVVDFDYVMICTVVHSRSSDDDTGRRGELQEDGPSAGPGMARWTDCTRPLRRGAGPGDRGPRDAARRDHLAGGAVAECLASALWTP